MRAAVAASLLALAVPGGTATATYTGGTLSLKFHYLMTCGQPGPGPVVVHLPRAFRLGEVRATVRGAARQASVSESTVTVTLPKPPQVTCMSIVEGTLPVRLSGVHAPAGDYTVRAEIRSRAFTARLRIR